jgi:hypothetical protein
VEEHPVSRGRGVLADLEVARGIAAPLALEGHEHAATVVVDRDALEPNFTCREATAAGSSTTWSIVPSSSTCTSRLVETMFGALPAPSTAIHQPPVGSSSIPSQSRVTGAPFRLSSMSSTTRTASSETVIAWMRLGDRLSSLTPHIATSSS